MPSSVSANKKASCRFSLFGLPHTCSMSIRLGRRAWITAKNANPVRQLGPKSFTSIPRRLKRTEHSNVVNFAYWVLKRLTSKGGAIYLVAVCWTHLSRAFLAPPCRGGRGFLLTGGLAVSLLLVELSSEEVLLDKA